VVSRSWGVGERVGSGGVNAQGDVVGEKLHLGDRARGIGDGPIGGAEIGDLERPGGGEIDCGGGVDDAGAEVMVECDACGIGNPAGGARGGRAAVRMTISCTSRQPRLGFFSNITATTPVAEGVADEVPPKSLA
jgi:hypothetical protein